MHFVYILYSASADKYYIGSSADPTARLWKHLSNHKGYTGGIKDWIIAYQDEFEDKRSALIREKELKGWKSKIKLKALAGKT
jgi:putative endonuclease